GNKVCCLDAAPPDKVCHIGDENFSYIQSDIMSGCLGGMINMYDVVYHLAAIADPAVYCDDPVKVLAIDLEMTQEIIKQCWKQEKKLIFASTSEVYGKNSQLPWDEGADRVLGPTYTPRWVYATAKAMGEHYCYAYGKCGLEFVILRFFNFYGPRLDFIGQGRVIPCFLEKFFKGEDVEVVLPGTQTRCFTYITDGIEGIIESAHREEAVGKVFNLGSQYEISIADLAHLIKKIGKFKSNIIHIDAEEKYGEGYDDIPRRVPDCTKAYCVLNWKAYTTLNTGLYRTIEYFKEEYENGNNAA
ncbi:MAG TPA: NAD-dependent epimerase/dehydratase family protein, partial [archaeon]|nr:NAD-dependent epimerase/dehydratase family protein [archaeon]